MRILIDNFGGVNPVVVLLLLCWFLCLILAVSWEIVAWSLQEFDTMRYSILRLWFQLWNFLDLLKSCYSYLPSKELGWPSIGLASCVESTSIPWLFPLENGHRCWGDNVPNSFAFDQNVFLFPMLLAIKISILKRGGTSSPNLSAAMLVLNSKSLMEIHPVWSSGGYPPVPQCFLGVAQMNLVRAFVMLICSSLYASISLSR